MKAISNGVFQGDNPLDYALPLVILQICLVVLVTRLLDFLLRPRRQPRVIAEIVKSPQGPQKEVNGNINLCYQTGDEGADSGTAPCGDFDVFLSFRGPDTRDTFTDCLYEYMNRTGIRIFRDEEALGPGKNISEILGAVQRSQLYIIVFSQGYASSRWCLRELTCMVECTRQSTGKEILPIFFDVEPLDVKLETEMYNSALSKHEEELGCAEVKPWKEALTTVARIKGWCVKGRRQGKVIADITEKVLQKITIRKRYLPTDLVGIDDHVEAIKKLLSCDTSGVRFVIIHGIGGIGKTSLAETVYNQLFPQFEGHSFLSNIHESSSCRGILKMQRKLVEDLFGFSLHETIDPKEGNNLIKEILPKKRVLLVLDDMDEKDQFMNMAMNSYSYGPGSRIIITTRDFPMTNADGLEENVLTQSGHIFPYEMKEMHFDHALLLFNKRAFNMDYAPCDLYDLSRQVVELTGGLPLAVEVIGSHLRTISKAKWKTTLKKLKEVPHEKVRQRLQISYDALGCEGQQIFLDIGCFFVNKEKANAMYMWEACDFYPEVEIDILIRKSLIKIHDDRILMHGQLRDLAREIIRQENIRNCGDRSRLWFLEMSQAQKGTENVVALTPRRSRHNFTREDFANFTNARFLRLDGGNFADDCEDILPELRWLCWQNCPSKLRANNLVLNRLVVLKLSGNITTEEWSGWVKIMVQFHQVASKLKVLKIAGSKSLIKTPHFSEFMSLERLVLKDFLRLAEIDSSIGELRQLSYLKIKWCPRLRELPKEIGCLTALKELILIQGHSVCDFPESIGNIRGLSRLVMEDTGLVELPDTIRGLADLKHLSLVNCSNLNSLPDAVGELKSLTELDLSGTTIGNLPRFIWDLENLTVRMNSFGIRAPPMRDLPMQGLGVRHSPDLTGNLRSWLRLSMDERGSAGFPETINGLGDHEYLHLSDFTNLNSLSDAVGELRTSTELYLSGTANWEQEMEEMHFDHALQLFSEHAFHTDSAPWDRQVVEPYGSLGDRTRFTMELSSALAFLHSCKPHNIVHRDLKPSNILLNTHPMSNSTTVLCPIDPTGTFGYMDPEFLAKRELTTKFDVHSLGITLLQVLTRRPALGIANVVQRATSAGTLEAMLDRLAGEQPYMVAQESTHLALSCCEMSRRSRPDPRSVDSAPIDRSFQRVSTKLVTPVPEDRIYVAVGKDMKEGKANLAWTVHQSGSKVKICIIHVLVPTQTIPMGGLGAKSPANSAYEIMLREHRENERINMHKILDTYLGFCQKMGVPVEKEYVESNIVQKGFVELIHLHGTRKLVMGGAAARRYFKYVQEQATYLSENRQASCLHITRKVGMRAVAANRYFRKMAEIKFRKAIFVRNKAPFSCPIWFICDRHLIHTRDPSSQTTSTPEAGNSILSKSRSATLQRNGTVKLSNPFQDILKRAFSSADGYAAMPIASPSPDSTPSVQPSAASIVQRQETFQEIGQFSRSPSHRPHSIQSDHHIRSLIFNTSKKMVEVLEKMEDQLDTVMEKLRVAQAQKSQLKDQFVETDQSRKELELNIIATDETSWTFRQKRELLQIDFQNALQKAKEVSRRKGDSSGTEYFSKFSMTEIKEAVQSVLSLKIGEGGCGSVYRGFLRHTPVAIKIMKFPSVQGSPEFQQELDMLSKARHPHLISACPDPCTLVYEHIPSGSLGDWLCSSSNRAKQLPWQVRIRIATELCSVLAFLHSWKPHSIVHGDVKPGNILLDAHHASKLSDFGICRLLSHGEPSSNSTTVLCPTDPMGTFGYMDPDFLVTRELTTKFDIYSFGIILLELLTRRPALGIANIVRRAINAGTLKSMLNPLAGKWSYKLAEESTHLALRCCEMSRRNRPDLWSDVWTALQSIGASYQ